MKLDQDLMISMIRDHFRYKSDAPDTWDSYPIRIDSYQSQEKTIFVWYFVTITHESLNCIRIDKKEYESRISYREASERNKKIDSILKRSFFDKIKDVIK